MGARRCSRRPSSTSSARGTTRAIDQTDLIPIDQPEVEIDAATVREGDPARFAAVVAVRPTVTLGAYTDYPFGLEVPAGDR